MTLDTESNSADKTFQVEDRFGFTRTEQVHVWFKDAAGNISTPVSDTINVSSSCGN